MFHNFAYACAFATLLAVPATARDVPANVKAFYDQVRGRQQCSTVLKTGFHSKEGGKGDYGYCGDYLSNYNVIYIQGSGGRLANMDIDCDGAQTHGDGRCGSSTDTQSQTSFKSEIQGYKAGINDLNAYVHPYVVFGNDGSKPGWPTFDPKKHGIEPLSVMAVVCNNKVIYGIWGDTNGDDGSQAMVGEASLSLATACFGTGMNGNAGHDQSDVLYIAFPGKDAVPGAHGATWAANTYDEFEDSISALGNRLLKRIRA
ncbi:fungal chitosanase [Colletotrichum melonis]|uniref:Endo-chitosanase n=1 Tax=Colletotrichum melonis TaxID=1209925 RepID=A0AAI9UUI8_9PEZI|nr:fungal chitosanase [Colletotrichum melonis]